MNQGSVSLALAPAPPRRPLYFAAKRLADAAVALVGLIGSAPLWALIAAAIWLQDRGAVFYASQRVARSGGTFGQIKFRSMIPHAERHTGPVFSSERDPRITPVGRLLRKTALDELPQLINILKGEMSFVGPRPERPVFVEQFARQIPNYGLRHLVRPGLTGLAQVYGRYNTAARCKLRYDLLYVRRCSALLDLRLFAASLLVTVKGRWDSRARSR